MKKLLISALFLSAFTMSFAQQDTLGKKEADRETWYHKDFGTTNVYGINTEKAYQFLDSKGLKPTSVLVAVIDSGVQIDHPGLIANIYSNPKEIPGNGIDDDKNGYIDDVHGWSFLGGKDSDVDVDTMEVTRIVKKYQPIFEGSDSKQNKENQAKMPEEFKLYMEANNIFVTKSLEAKQNYVVYQEIKKSIPNMMALLDGKTLTEENINNIKPKSDIENNYVFILQQMVKDPTVAGLTPEEATVKFEKEIDEALEALGKQATLQYNLEYDPRSMVGDDYDNKTEKYYGNNHYEGPDAMHGTHVAGIIAGMPNATNSQHGIAYKVAKLITVRAVPDGDERDKDVANSIIYAVNQGAKILNMSFGKPVSPEKEMVWKAFKYADEKGVLLVKAAGNDNKDIANDIAYPTNFKNPTDEKPFIDNMIVVGASTNNSEALRAPFSNYNQKMVDVFAPGADIFSTVTKGEYKFLDGTSMASPVVSGAAAVLLAYMPNLTPKQIIESLVNTVNKSTVDAKTGASVNNTFNYMSRAGGVIDLYKAAEYAYNKFYKPENNNKHQKVLPRKKHIKVKR